MGDLHLTLLGGFELRTGARPVTIAAVKTRALLAVLALGAGRAHGREALATLLWGGHGERRARPSLRQALFPPRQAPRGAPPPRPPRRRPPRAPPPPAGVAATRRCGSTRRASRCCDASWAWSRTARPSGCTRTCSSRESAARPRGAPATCTPRRR